MRKIKLLILLTVSGIFSASAQTATINSTFIILGINGIPTYGDLQAATLYADFQGANLGTFTIGVNSLTFQGAEHNITKCNGCNITSSRLYYRIYKTGTTPGTFVSNSVPMVLSVINGCSGADQQWKSIVYNTNLLAGLLPGQYTMEAYSDASVTCGTGTLLANNGGLNYKATFIVAASASQPVVVSATGGTTFATYATVKAAFDAVNAGTHTGIISTVVGGNTTEPAAGAVLNASGTGSSSYTSLTLTGDGMANRVVTGAVTAGLPLIDLNGADNVTIGEFNSTYSFQFVNSTISATAGTSVMRLINGATGNTVRYCSVLGYYSGSAGVSGNILFSTDAAGTGNDNNTISNNSIGSTRATGTASAAVCSFGSATAGHENSGNIITANNFFDCFAAATTSAFIYFGQGTTDCSITNNRFYQTAAGTLTAAVGHYAVLISNSTGNNFQVTGNTIGYATAAGTGVYNITANVSGAASGFTAISVSAGTTTASSIQDNTITGIKITSANNAFTTTGLFSAIYVSGGLVNVGTVTGNTIGATTGTGSIDITATATGANYLYILYANSTANININNNKIGSITATGSIAGAGLNFYSIYASSGGVCTINANTVGNTTANNIAVGAGGFTTGACYYYGIAASSTGAINTGASGAGNTLQNTIVNSEATNYINTITTNGNGTAFSVGYNTIAGFRSGSTNATATYFGGIVNNGSPSASVSITNNTLGTAASGAMTFAGASTGSVTVLGNYSSGSGFTTDISNNTVTGISLLSASSVIGIGTSGTPTTVNINNNNFGTASLNFVTFTAAASTNVSVIDNNAFSNFTSLSITGNNIRGIVHNLTGSGTCSFIRNSRAATTVSISNNLFTNLVINSTGQVYFIQDNSGVASGATQTVSNNAVSGTFSKTGAGGMVYFFYSSDFSNAIVPGATVNHTNNNFSNVTVTGACNITGWYSAMNGTGVRTVSGNTFDNWQAGTGICYGVFADNPATTGPVVDNNTFSNWSGGGYMYGVQVGFNITNISITGNQIYNLTSTGTAATVHGIFASGAAAYTISGNTIYAITGAGTGSFSISGITMNGGTTTNIFRNKIYGISATAAGSAFTPLVAGINLYAGTTVNVYNNLVGNITAPAANSAEAVRGIAVTATGSNTSFNLSFNTIYLQGSSAGTNFGTACVFQEAAFTATTASLTMKNNILVNLSTPNGTGLAVAFKRSMGSSGYLVNYNAASNNNLFYAGTPSSTHLIYSDGNATAQTFAAYKAGVFTAGTIAPRDQNSFTENPSFLSTTGSSPNFLHIDPAVNTLIESGGIAVAGIGDDFDGESRPGNAVSNLPDAGADEFTGKGPVPVIANVTVPAGTCAGGAHAINADITVTRGIINNVTINYNNGSAGSVTMTFVSGNTYTGSIPAGAAGVAVTWSITATTDLLGSATYTGTSYTDVATGTWLGITADWFTASNWCGGLPLTSTAVTIPSGTPFPPNINAAGAVTGNISIASGTSLTITSTGELFTAGNFSNSGTFTNNGLLKLNGNSNQTFPGTGTMNPQNNIEIDNTSGGVTLNKSFAVTGTLKPTSGILALGNFTVTLTSNTTATAAVGSAGGTAGFSYGASGGFVIERYLFAKKAWRFLSVPVKAAGAATVYDAWQEGGSTASTGYGTQITGPSGSIFDATSVGYSMKSYDMATESFIPVTNTNGSIANDRGYFVFVRGDRSVGAAGGPAATTLRAKGQLNTGDFPVTVNAGKFQSLANPYASRIDFRTITKTNIADGFTVWNPTAPGANNAGAYEQYIFSAGDYKKVPLALNVTKNFIESGEAVMIQSISGGSVTVKETDKGSGSANVSFTGGSFDPTLDIALYGKDAGNTEYIADGVTINFDEHYSNALDNDDMRKLMNTAENISIATQGKQLAVERRNMPQANDTIHLNLTGMREATYRFEINGSNMINDATLQPVIMDKFTGAETPFLFNGTATISFDITAAAGSKAADRFMIVFRPAIVVPVRFTSITAIQNADKTNTIKWNTQNETGIDHYELERSADRITFASLGNTAPQNNNGGSGAYSKTDAAPLAVNYYRVKAVSTNGQVQYTSIVKVSAEQSAGITVIPNPVKDKTIGLFVNGLPKGNYIVLVLSSNGQIFYNSKMVLTGSASQQNIFLNKNTPAGNYEVVLVSEKGERRVAGVVVW